MLPRHPLVLLATSFVLPSLSLIRCAQCFTVFLLTSNTRCRICRSPFLFFELFSSHFNSNKLSLQHQTLSPLLLNVIIHVHQAIYKNTEVQQVNLAATSGDMGVLANHVPTIEQLKAGVVEVFENASTTKKYFGKCHSNKKKNVARGGSRRENQLLL
jgi:hypothetical protein